jgi:hypothetical protein
MKIFQRKLNHQGFAHIEYIVLLLVVVGVFSVGYYVYEHDAAHAGSTYTTLASVSADNHIFTLQACITSQSGSSSNYTDAVSALISVNTQTGRNSSGRHHRYSSYNPLAYYSLNNGKVVTESNWLSGSVSSVNFDLPPILGSSSFVLGVEGTPGSTDRTSGPSRLISSISLCNPPVKAKPTVSLGASPTTVVAGSTSTLSWTTTNATSCIASGTWSGTELTAGSYITPGLSTTSSYTLTCTGPGGSTGASSTITVTPKPTTSPTPPPTIITPPTTTTGSGTSSLGGCTNAGTVAPCIGSATTGASGWGTPVFDDEFNGTSLDTTNWSTSWFNGGTQNGVSTSAANVSVSGGDLILTLASSSSGASVSTNPNGGASTGFQFGDGYYVEASIYFPGSGTSIYNWPAFWATGQSWPADGEDDIAEGLGTLTTNYHSNLGASNSGTIAGTWSSGWHTYGMNRQNGTNYIYWDGQLVRQYTTDDSGSPQYLILNVGSGNTAAYGSASQVKVDYVRVWQ